MYLLSSELVYFLYPITISPYMQIWCVAMAFIPVQTGCLQGINAVGRSDVFLKLAVIKTSCSLAALLGAVMLWDSPLAIAQVTLVTTLISCVVNAFFCRRIVGYGLREQLADIAPSGILSAVMLLAVIPAGWLHLSALKLLAVQVMVGVTVYLLGSAVLRPKAFRQLLKLVKNRIGKLHPENG